MQMKICAALLLLPCCTAFLPPSMRVGHEACSRVAGARRSSPRMVLEGLDGVQAALTPTNVVGFGSLGLFGLRMYTYFSAQVIGVPQCPHACRPNVFNMEDTRAQTYHSRCSPLPPGSIARNGYPISFISFP
jgi:hypothetical protein